MKTKQRYAPPKTQTAEKPEVNRSSARLGDTGVMSASGSAPGVVIGKLVGFSATGQPQVAFNLETVQCPQEAISLAVLAEVDVGSEVVLSFAQNRNDHPVIMGVVQSPVLGNVLDNVLGEVEAAEPSTAASLPELLVNGEKLNITAAKEITLRCGKSSITLTESGKILIKGEHILSRAAGANRVKGGSIQLN